jgi:ferredoxin-NADP reductase
MRELSNLQLKHKHLVSEQAQCFHLTFAVAPHTLEVPKPGQFFSLVAPDAAGKAYTRAYSVASVPRMEPDGSFLFDLCVNRVANGFFSNLLCDLEPGAMLQGHGPHGLFTLPADAPGYLFIAESTGIAPIRAFLQQLYPATTTPTRLLYWAPRQEELFYAEELTQLADEQPWFQYVPVIGTYPYHYPALLELLPQPGAELPFICGLSAMVRAVRQQLLALGWERRAIQSERYD